MNSLLADLRFGFRMLWKHPAFTAAAIITLALGIGANTAIFSVVNAVLLKELPVADPDRLVMVYCRPVPNGQPGLFPHYENPADQRPRFYEAR